MKSIYLKSTFIISTFKIILHRSLIVHKNNYTNNHAVIIIKHAIRLFKSFLPEGPHHAVLLHRNNHNKEIDHAIQVASKAVHSFTSNA